MISNQFILPIASELAIDRGADGRPMTKTAQVRMCGNSVCPPLAQAIVSANYTERQALEQAARALPQPQQAIDKAQHTQPVLTVEIEPDYWSGGHFHEGTKSWINPTKVWALPIGTKLYAVPNHTPPVPCSGGPYVG